MKEAYWSVMIQFFKELCEVKTGRSSIQLLKNCKVANYLGTRRET